MSVFRTLKQRNRDPIRTVIDALTNYLATGIRPPYQNQLQITDLLHAKQHFVIRVGSNVKLLKNLGYARQHDQTVSLWLDKFTKKKMPPLELRLIVVHDGRHLVYLATSMTKKKDMSDRQAAEIYRRRWGIEVFFARSSRRSVARNIRVAFRIVVIR